MAHGFAIKLLWRFSCPGNTTGSPATVTVNAQPSHQHPVFQNGYVVRIYRAWSLFLILSMCSSTIHFADTRPHSPTTFAYDSITHTSFVGITPYHLCEADHAPTCAYRFLRFSFVRWVHITPRVFIAFFSDDALNPPSSSPPPRPRRHVFFASIAVSTSGRHISSSSKHHPRSIIICPRQPTGPRQACAQPPRPAAQQRLQPKSHSPAPLRTLLRL